MPERPSRRVLVVVAILVMALAILGVSYVRIADRHAEPSWSALDTEVAPAALVEAAQEQLHRVDHRTVTRVSRVEDGDEETVLVHEEVYDFSDGQYVANYAALDNASKAAWAQHHSLIAQLGGRYLDGGEGRLLYYADEGGPAVFVSQPGPVDAQPGSVDAGAESVDDVVGSYRLPDGETIGSTRRGASIGPAYQYPFFLTHGVDWEVDERGEETLTVVVDDPNDYLGARRLFGIEDIHEGSRLSIVFDRQTGQPRRVSERRIVSYVEDLDDGTTVVRRETFVLETTFRDYGAVDVSSPARTPPPTLADLLEDFRSY